MKDNNSLRLTGNRKPRLQFCTQPDTEYKEEKKKKQKCQTGGGECLGYDHWEQFQPGRSLERKRGRQPKRKKKNPAKSSPLRAKKEKWEG